MRVSVFDSAAALAGAAAARVAEAVTSTPALVLGLPAGRTPLATYAVLHELHARGSVRFEAVTTFALDEFAGLSFGHPAAFRTFLDTHVVRALGVSGGCANFLDGSAPDADEECRRYETALARAGGLDLQLLGIGRNGHIGFNEPGETLTARTHRVALHEATRRDNAHLFGGRLEDVPREGLTMGIGTIIRARSVLLLATGAEKAAAVAAAVEGPLTTRVPASLLQLHGSVEVYLDRAAAAALDSRAR